MFILRAPPTDFDHRQFLVSLFIFSGTSMTKDTHSELRMQLLVWLFYFHSTLIILLLQQHFILLFLFILFVMKHYYKNLLLLTKHHPSRSVSFQELERQAKSHGLPVTDFNWQGITVNSPPPYNNSYNHTLNPPSSLTTILPSVVLQEPLRKVSTWNKKDNDVI